MSKFEINSYEKISFICNDAGAANIIISWIKKKKLHNFSFFFNGPAKEIAKIEIPTIKQDKSLIKCIKKSEIIITGSGWMSNLEHQAIKLSNSLNKKTISVVDHWINYKDRFIRDNELVLPDEIWVTDKYAYKYASKIFTNTKIRLKKNTYLKELVCKVKIKEKNFQKNRSESNYLYVAEPMRTNWGKRNQGEFQALDYFCKYLTLSKNYNEVVIYLRLHPSESRKKYNKWIKNKKNKGYQIKIDINQNIENSIARSDYIVGCQTYPMIIALLAGKKVLSSLPPWAPRCKIPYKKLIHITDKINNSN